MYSILSCRELYIKSTKQSTMQTHTTEYEYVMQASHIAYAYYNGTCKRFSLVGTLAFQIHSERKGWFPSSFFR